MGAYENPSQINSWTAYVDLGKTISSISDSIAKSIEQRQKYLYEAQKEKDAERRNTEDYILKLKTEDYGDVGKLDTNQQVKDAIRAKLEMGYDALRRMRMAETDEERKSAEIEYNKYLEIRGSSGYTIENLNKTLSDYSTQMHGSGGAGYGAPTSYDWHNPNNHETTLVLQNVRRGVPADSVYFDDKTNHLMFRYKVKDANNNDKYVTMDANEAIKKPVQTIANPDADLTQQLINAGYVDNTTKLFTNKVFVNGSTKEISNETKQMFAQIINNSGQKTPEGQASEVTWISANLIGQKIDLSSLDDKDIKKYFGVDPKSIKDKTKFLFTNEHLNNLNKEFKYNPSMDELPSQNKVYNSIHREISNNLINRTYSSTQQSIMDAQEKGRKEKEYKPTESDELEALRRMAGDKLKTLATQEGRRKPIKMAGYKIKGEAFKHKDGTLSFLYTATGPTIVGKGPEQIKTQDLYQLIQTILPKIHKESDLYQ